MFDPQASVKTEQKKRIARQKKGVLRFLLMLTGILLLCVLLIGVSYLFRIRSIRLTGDEDGMAGQALTDAGITVGAPYSAVNPKEVAEVLEQTDFRIRGVSVEKNLLGHVTVTIDRYLPAFCIKADNGCFLVSDDLFVLDEVWDGSGDAFLLVLLPDGRSAEPGKSAVVWKEEPIALERISAALAAQNGLRDVTTIDLTSRYYYRLHTASGVSVVLGDTDNLAVKLELAAAVLDENKEKTWSHAEVNVADPKKTTFRIID